MGYLLLIISYLLRTYGAVQDERDPINTPMIWQSDPAKTILSLVWIILLVISVYLIYNNNGFVVLVISLLVYFLFAPILFGKMIKNILNRTGF